jgi:aspartate racemase
MKIKSTNINNILLRERAGADFAIMAANSPHSVLEEIRNDIPIPVLSIVDAVGQRGNYANSRRTRNH